MNHTPDTESIKRVAALELDLIETINKHTEITLAEVRIALCHLLYNSLARTKKYGRRGKK